MKVFGVVGWKNTGKTGLVERLVAEISGRGFRVSTIKHAHHVFDVDQPGRDSYRHREAGAVEVMLASRKRWALMHELRDEAEWELDDLLTKMTGVDLVLVEGVKLARHDKLEAYRSVVSKPLISNDNSSILAIASDAELDTALPVLDLDDTGAISDFILSQTGLA